MQTSEFVSTRRLGSAEITVISEGVFWWNPRFAISEADRRRALPEADGQGRIRLGFNCALVRLGPALIMIDPGFDDPGSVWDRAFAQQWPGCSRTPGLAAALGTLGVHPEQITHVLITHAHGDHFAGVTVEREGVLVPRFAGARHCIGRADWVDNPRRTDPATDLAARLGLIESQTLLDPVDGAREIVQGVTMLPSPGETAGHMIVRVQSGGLSFYYVGDLFHHACEVEHLDWVSPNRDPAVMHASRDQLMAEASTAGALVVFSHEPFPGWGRIVPAPPGHRWEPRPSG